MNIELEPLSGEELSVSEELDEVSIISRTRNGLWRLSHNRYD